MDTVWWLIAGGVIGFYLGVGLMALLVVVSNRSGARGESLLGGPMEHSTMLR